MRKLMWVILAMFVALGVSAAPQGGQKKGAKPAVSKQTQDRVSGKIIRSNKEASNLTVRERRSGAERIVLYSAATKWTKNKGKEAANMEEFKDGAVVVCLGKYNDKGALVATHIALQ